MYIQPFTTVVDSPEIWNVIRNGSICTVLFTDTAILLCTSVRKWDGPILGNEFTCILKSCQVTHVVLLVRHTFMVREVASLIPSGTMFFAHVKNWVTLKFPLAKN